MKKQPNLLLSYMKITQTQSKFNTQQKKQMPTKTKTQKLATVATTGDKKIFDN